MASTSSPAGPSKANSPEALNNVHVPHTNGSPWPMGRTVSGMSIGDKALDPTKLLGDINPDELFTTHSVSEVRKVQQRLRCVCSGRLDPVYNVRLLSYIG